MDDSNRPTESFGPDKSLVALWTVLVSIPLPLLVWAAVKQGYLGGLAVPLALCMVLPGMVLAFALRFRVTFTPHHFVYRRWGSTHKVAYRDIRSIEVTNVTPLSKDAIGAFIVTREGSRLPFWPKLFPRAAVDRFFQLAPAEVRK